MLQACGFGVGFAGQTVHDERYVEQWGAVDLGKVVDAFLHDGGGGWRKLEGDCTYRQDRQDARLYTRARKSTMLSRMVGTRD
jgi:hypothetical protein